jgi:hypothetical protein
MYRTGTGPGTGNVGNVFCTVLYLRSDAVMGILSTKGISLMLLGNSQLPEHKFIHSHLIVFRKHVKIILHLCIR